MVNIGTSDTDNQVLTTNANVNTITSNLTTNTFAARTRHVKVNHAVATTSMAIAARHFERVSGIFDKDCEGFSSHSLLGVARRPRHTSTRHFE
jgi:hypothetical protein